MRAVNQNSTVFTLDPVQPSVLFIVIITLALELLEKTQSEIQRILKEKNQRKSSILSQQ